VSSVSTDARPVGLDATPEASRPDTSADDASREAAADHGAPEAAADHGAPEAGADGTADATDAVDAAAPCDLLLQDCPDRKACYPDDAQTGRTVCLFPGSSPPLTLCASSTECDAREVCAYVADAQTNECAPLCDPMAAATGCAPGAACVPIPGYRAGYCTP
jgi:hypothetical protein